MADFTIIKRADAHRAGLKKYYTGKSCAKGHDVQRWVSSGICTVCARLSVGKYNAKMRGADASFMVRCHTKDEESIRQFVAGLAAARDARTAANIERHGDVKPPIAPQPNAPAFHIAPCDFYRTQVCICTVGAK